MCIRSSAALYLELLKMRNARMYCWDLKCEPLSSTLDVLECKCKRMMIVILF
jgi:hypothetical protein